MKLTTNQEGRWVMVAGRTPAILVDVDTYAKTAKVLWLCLPDTNIPFCDVESVPFASITSVGPLVTAPSWTPVSAGSVQLQEI